MVLSEEEVYKNRKIRITVEKNKPRLYVDDKQVHSGYQAGGDMYFSNLLPYKTFPSRQKLAEALIDNKRI